MRTALAIKAISVFCALAGVGVSAQALQCMQGPLPRSLGGLNWNVYACDDHHSLVVTVVESTPQLPFFYFFVTVRGTQVEVIGEGNGEKSLTDRAYQALSRLTAAEVAGLVVEARRVAASRP